MGVLWFFREYSTSATLREPVKSVNDAVGGGEEVEALVLLLRTYVALEWEVVRQSITSAWSMVQWMAMKWSRL